MALISMVNSPAQDTQWIEIGTIVAPHGLKGEVRVKSASDFPERFEEAGRRWLKTPSQAQPQPIELIQGYQIPGKEMYVVKLEGINYRDEAEKLRGCQLYVDEEDIPELDEDEYHVSELVNLGVYHHQTGEKIGVVVDLYIAGHDLLEVQLEKQPQPKPEKPLPDVSKINRKSKLKKKRKPKKQKLVTILIPFVAEIVPVIDLENQRIEVNPPPGLLEIHES